MFSRSATGRAAPRSSSRSNLENSSRTANDSAASSARARRAAYSAKQTSKRTKSTYSVKSNSGLMSRSSSSRFDGPGSIHARRGCAPTDALGPSHKSFLSKKNRNINLSHGRARFTGHDSHLAKDMAKAGKNVALRAQQSSLAKPSKVGRMDTKMHRYHRRFSTLGCIYKERENTRGDMLGAAHRDISKGIRGGKFSKPVANSRDAWLGKTDIQRTEAFHSIGVKDINSVAHRVQKMGGIKMSKRGAHSRFSMVGEDFATGAENMQDNFA